MLSYVLKLLSSSGENGIVCSLYLRLYGSVWNWQWGIALPPLLLTLQQQAGRVQAVAFTGPVSCCSSVIELPLLFSPCGTNVFVLLSLFICGESCQDCLSFMWDDFICLSGTAHCVNCSLCLGMQHWGKGFLWFVVQLWNYVDISQWWTELPVSLYDQRDRFIGW